MKVRFIAGVLEVWGRKWMILNLSSLLAKNSVFNSCDVHYSSGMDACPFIFWSDSWFRLPIWTSMTWIHNELSGDSSSSLLPVSLISTFPWSPLFSFFSLSESLARLSFLCRPISIQLNHCPLSLSFSSYMSLAPSVPMGWLLLAFINSLKGSVSNAHLTSLIVCPCFGHMRPPTRTPTSLCCVCTLNLKQPIVRWHWLYIPGWMSVIFQSVEHLKNLRDRGAETCRHSHLFENAIIPLFILSSRCVSAIPLCKNKQIANHIAVEFIAQWKLTVKQT